MADKDVDPNTTLIPREVVDRKKILDSKIGEKSPVQSQSAFGGHKFDIIPVNAIDEAHPKVDDKSGERQDEEQKPNKENTCQHCGGAVCSKCGQPLDGSGKRRITGDNYQQMYLEQKRLDSMEDSDKLGDLKEQSRAKAAKESMDKKQADEARARARELQNQIVWWRQQAGMGQYDDATINGAVATLEFELNSIPPMYWF